MVIRHKKFRQPMVGDSNSSVSGANTAVTKTIVKTTSNSSNSSNIIYNNNNTNVSSVNHHKQIEQNPNNTNNEKTAICDSNAKLSNNNVITITQTAPNTNNLQQQQQHLQLQNRLHQSSSSVPHMPATATVQSLSRFTDDPKIQQNPFLSHTDDLNRRFSIDTLLKYKKKIPPS